MGSDAAEIEWLHASRLSELQAFLAAEWRPNSALALDAELVAWQHPRDDDRLSVVAASENGRLIGVLGVIPVDVGVRGQRVHGAWLTTWAVTPAARPRQLGLALLDFALQRHEFAGTLGGNATTMTILKALRFVTVPAVPRWICPLDTAALSRIAERPSAPPPPSVDAAGWSLRDWRDEDAPAWDRFWTESLAPTLVGTWREAAYLDWRYRRHPRFEYSLRVAESTSGELGGLLVHRAERVEGTEPTVLRVVEALGVGAAVAALAAELVRTGQAAGAAFADFYCTGERFAKPLEEAGFTLAELLPADVPSHFQPLEPTSRPLTAALRLASSPSGGPLTGPDVYFTRADCDQDRPA